MGGEVSEYEALQKLCEGLKKSASCARELAALMNDPSWSDTAQALDVMRENCRKLAQMRSMTKMEVEQALNLKVHAGRTH